MNVSGLGPTAVDNNRGRPVFNWLPISNEELCTKQCPRGFKTEDLSTGYKDRGADKGVNTGQYRGFKTEDEDDCFDLVLYIIFIIHS